MFNILIPDDLSAAGLELLHNDPAVRVDVVKKMPRAELLERIPEYHALIVRSETKVDAEVIARGSKLRVIGRAGIGVDTIDVEAATHRGIIVMNTPQANTTATCEHTLAMMLALARNIPQADASLRRGEWTRSKFMGVQLQGKTLGVIGLGRIGTQVAKRAQCFGMEVIAYDPYVSEEAARANKVVLVSLDELLAQSDFVTLHSSLTQGSRGLLDAAAIAKMKPGARVINVARGALVDSQALYEALASGKLAGAALDVFEEEPLPPDSPLLKLPNIVLTPHLGASTVEAQRDVSIQIAEQVLDALHERDVRNAVNFPPIDPAAWPIIRPYLKLAEKLGRLQAGLMEGRLARIEVEYRGADVAPHVKPLTVALLRGLLEPILGGEKVNYVNAPVIANERGIIVTQALNLTSSDYTNLVSCRVTTDQEERTIAGTLFDGVEPHIVQIDQFRIDAVPEGLVLVISSRDVPGVIGRVGTILGANYVNIAEYRLGRTKPGDRALSFINLDNPVPDYALKALHDLPEVVWAKQITL
ncbi:MAG: phosphoglycerate dehydrogenase [Chloroflexi bacterium]|jgi:D-3-phosphoglycerate dehydrogenase|uniref:D-3-phosphoglycerate dehydrogenase n=1 Tax=Candidatus Thermofonsia Clade 3 bacterium TaxID=2364212 RepID=A0A2M8QC82_9CHLR|nr:phosphoglycerate dehydrogenase [Candidatus Roseilinea sp. NK_OTU-006]PJF47399.1 MAG: phosphoglycerate dehydrogenase [Candidatus Thermofonsia Clade 3 bacterium]RMG65820.1 MAG: phosphoglycerate dehydrogenase [Chloroflexota bacterium]